MLGLLDSVTAVMQREDEWRKIGMSDAELALLKKQAEDDIVQNAASRRYYWIL